VSEHTPGPWTLLSGFPEKIVPVAHKSRSLGGSINEDDDRDHFALVIATAERNRYSKFAHEISEEQARANARLMAAAPELLAALQGMVPPVLEWKEQGDGTLLLSIHKNELRAARAAIAKATGGAP
jgi:hypothetical protein